MSLLFNVSQLLKSEIGQTRVYALATDGPMDLDDVVADRISGSVKFILTNFGVLAHGHVDAVLCLTCARCLEEFESPIAVDFEEEYQPLIDIATGLPSRAPRSDTAFIIAKSHNIDLTEAVRQNLLLAVEMVPLCSPGCKGLCALCGTNRNLEPCHCHEADASSPFAVLQGLLSQTDANS